MGELMHTVKREEISFTLTFPQDTLQLKKCNTQMYAQR